MLDSAAMPRWLVVVVAVLAVVLVATAVAAPFTIDENNYLVTLLGLRAGGLTVPGTEGLPPSRELLYFDPTGLTRIVRSTPVSSLAPPLYAVLAYPFSFLGWRGLVAVNALAFAAAILICFAFARGGGGRDAPWVAAAAIGVGAYFFEYAQGMWPHMLTMALIAGATFMSARALDDSRWVWGAAAGFLSALAAGVRYQNAFVLGCLGLGLALLSRFRVRAVAAFVLGAALPLIASSAMNHERLGSWNPISKGPGYLVSKARMTRGEGTFLGKFSTMAWARIVDYSARPPLTHTLQQSFLTPQPKSGAYVLVTAVKKAWLQSSPWLIVPLLLVLLAWLPARLFRPVLPLAPQRQLRLISLVVLPTLAMFSASGITRTDGLCFNQRYFCELVPLLAVALAWGVDGIDTRRTAVLAGGLAGAALAFASLRPHHLLPIRHYLVMYLPLGLAVVLAVCWLLKLWASGRSAERPARAALAMALGASIGWALVVHLGDDLSASRLMRRTRESYLRQLRPFIEDHSAVFASGGIKDALGPLQMGRDVVIALPAYDRGETTEELLDAFLEQRRHVYFLPNVLPKTQLDAVLEGRQVRALGRPVVLIEVRAP